MKVFLLFHFALVAVMFSACGDVNNQAQVEEFLANGVENNSTKNEENSTKQENENNVSSSNIVITTTTKTDENSDDTNSSSDEQNSTEENLNDLGNNPIIIDPNDTGSPDDSSNKTNSSLDENRNSVDENDTVIITNPDYDSTDAIVDLNACKIDFGIEFLEDHHENNEGFALDPENGITIRSIYPETGHIENSLVTVIFHKITKPEEINATSKKINTYGDNAQFILSFDKAWLNEDSNIFYVETPVKESGLKACFKLEISKEYNASDTNTTLESVDFTFQKVYR